MMSLTQMPREDLMMMKLAGGGQKVNERDGLVPTTVFDQLGEYDDGFYGSYDSKGEMSPSTSGTLCDYVHTLQIT